MLHCTLFGVWVWSLTMLGYWRSPQSISTILKFILISLAPKLCNWNCKSNIPLHKIFSCWSLWETFPLYPCRVSLDQSQLQIPNVFSLLFQWGSLPHPIYLILYLFWWSGYSDFFGSCDPRLLRVSFSNVCWLSPPWDLDKLWNKLLIALSTDDFIVMNSDLFKYLTNAPVLLNSYTFLALDFWVFWLLEYKMMRHNPVSKSWHPFMIALLSALNIVTPSILKLT